jgi:hypothetical protein
MTLWSLFIYVRGFDVANHCANVSTVVSNIKTSNTVSLAEAALADLQLLLKGESWEKGGGYKPSELDLWTWAQIEGI